MVGEGWINLVIPHLELGTDDAPYEEVDHGDLSPQLDFLSVRKPVPPVPEGLVDEDTDVVPIGVHVEAGVNVRFIRVIAPVCCSKNTLAITQGRRSPWAAPQACTPGIRRGAREREWKGIGQPEVVHRLGTLGCKVYDGLDFVSVSEVILNNCEMIKAIPNVAWAAASHP